ncbi:hypothetical protein HGO34_14570 [Agrobacterium vitis]|uniref:Uncharacterized protein n=2 Tax=Agrobacterium vitis TaxID=373 RepID=A0A6I4E2V4_AGRVI|nr:hypothetical protein [Agrobacterium vitis]MCF1499152.1 hypothetical protein [Allorhizobium sp. Av2]MCM2440941.1 hypothetical protein [Agrobacterium vitis]MUZ58600.1 hypothetical protein [Agrobacterium vitis]MUZ73963.1 hypothetical protein [Agrobacterium vitis]MVA65707.1 hypothetical protein [Agrobacterium vitis]
MKFAGGALVSMVTQTADGGFKPVRDSHHFLSIYAVVTGVLQIPQYEIPDTEQQSGSFVCGVNLVDIVSF